MTSEKKLSGHKLMVDEEDQHDRGDIGINLMVDSGSGYVTINLGTKVQFLALDKFEATYLAEELMEAAKQLPDRPMADLDSPN